MKNSKIKFQKIIILLLLATGLVLNGCKDDVISSENIIDEEPTLKSTFDNNFDWENSNQIQMKNNNGQIVSGKNVPWNWDSNAGVPLEWKDKNIQGSYSQKMYTKAKGWELVYSNIMEATSFKYIALYNKYTGIARFFMYIFADPGGAGTSQSLWGINVDKSSSILNFTKEFAEALDKKDSKPTYITTAKGSFANGEFTSVGLQSGIWYGFEVEFAYDPTITNKDFVFTLMGRAVDKIKYEGQMTTEGQIEGTIRGSSPSAGVNLSFSNMFNNNSTNKVINATTAESTEIIGKQIDEGIKKNDPFFKGLWNNIKNNASKWITTGLQNGAQKGLEAIVSQGGSVVADAFSGLLTSLIGGKKESVSKVELSVALNSKITLEGEKIMIGWSDQSFPIPGSSTIQTFKPIYNDPLGVWCLSNTPTIHVVGQYTKIYPPGSRIHQYHSEISYTISGKNDIILNPIIAKDFIVKNLKREIVFEHYYSTSQLSQVAGDEGDPTLINMQKYLKYGYSIYVDRPGVHMPIPTSKEGIVKISFDLVNKQTNEVQTYFTKYFKAPITWNGDMPRFIWVDGTIDIVED